MARQRCICSPGTAYSKVVTREGCDPPGAVAARFSAASATSRSSRRRHAVRAAAAASLLLIAGSLAAAPYAAADDETPLETTSALSARATLHWRTQLESASAAGLLQPPLAIASLPSRAMPIRRDSGAGDQPREAAASTLQLYPDYDVTASCFVRRGTARPTLPVDDSPHTDAGDAPHPHDGPPFPLAPCLQFFAAGRASGGGGGREHLPPQPPTATHASACARAQHDCEPLSDGPSDDCRILLPPACLTPRRRVNPISRDAAAAGGTSYLVADNGASCTVDYDAKTTASHNYSLVVYVEDSCSGIGS